MKRLPLTALLVVVLAGCGSDEGRCDEAAAARRRRPGRLTARPAETPADSGEAGTRKLGQARLYVPPGDGPKRLVVMLHGAGGFRPTPSTCCAPTPIGPA